MKLSSTLIGAVFAGSLAGCDTHEPSATVRATHDEKREPTVVPQSRDLVVDTSASEAAAELTVSESSEKGVGNESAEVAEPASQAPAKMSAADVREAVEEILRKYEVLIARGREMERVRQADDHMSMKRCGMEMRERQPVAKELEQRVRSLPLDDELRSALYWTRMTELCVSCMRLSAMRNCSLVEESVRATRKLLRKRR